MERPSKTPSVLLAFLARADSCCDRGQLLSAALAFQLAVSCRIIRGHHFAHERLAEVNEVSLPSLRPALLLAFSGQARSLFCSAGCAGLLAVTVRSLRTTEIRSWIDERGARVKGTMTRGLTRRCSEPRRPSRETISLARFDQEV